MFVTSTKLNKRECYMYYASIMKEFGLSNVFDIFVSTVANGALP